MLKCIHQKRFNIEPLNYFLASSDFCRSQITFKSLDPDQGRQKVNSDMDPNRLTLWQYI